MAHKALCRGCQSHKWPQGLQHISSWRSIHPSIHSWRFLVGWAPSTYPLRHQHNYQALSTPSACGQLRTGRHAGMGAKVGEAYRASDVMGVPPWLCPPGSLLAWGVQWGGIKVSGLFQGHRAAVIYQLIWKYFTISTTNKAFLAFTYWISGLG